MRVNELNGKRVLLVEDEALIAMLLQAMLEENGVEVVGPAATLDEALALSTEGHFDAALLDLNLEDGLSYPVAELLRARGLPFAITSGSANIDAAYEDVPTLSKPFLQSEVEDVLRVLLA